MPMQLMIESDYLRVAAALMYKLMEQHDLTIAEMLQAVSLWQTGAMKDAIRADRVDDPDHRVEWSDLRRKLAGG